MGRQQVWTSLILMLMLMIGQFVPFTYIAPLLHEVTGLDASLVPWVLLLNGVGSTLGVFVGGKLADRRLMPSLITMLALQAVVLAIMYAVSPYPLPMVAAITVWGGLNFAIGTPHPDPHPRLDRRRAQPGLLADPVRLQRRDRAGGLRRRDDAQRRLRLPQPAAARHRGDDRRGGRCSLVLPLASGALARHRRCRPHRPNSPTRSDSRRGLA